MIVLTILLLILKIIGIIILSVLGFVLFVLAILLFAPAFYRAEANFKNESYSVDAVVYWLIVKFKYAIDNQSEGKTEIIFPFGIGSEENRQKKEMKQRIAAAKKKKAEAKKAKKHNPSKNTENDKNSEVEKIEKIESEKKNENIIKEVDNNQSDNNQTVEETEEKNTENLIQTPEDEPHQSITESDEITDKITNDTNEKIGENKIGEVEKPEIKTEEKSFLEKVKLFCKKIKRAITLLIKKPKRLYDKIVRYVAKIRSMNEKYNFKAVTKQTFLFFKRFFTALGLKKFQICGIIGLGDPADTGQLIALISAVGSFIPVQKNIRGDFQNKNTDLSANLKGRTSLFALLFPIARYVLNKDILPIIKENMD